MYGTANAVALLRRQDLLLYPHCSDLPIDENVTIHICENNTIYGTKFWQLPNTKGAGLRRFLPLPVRAGDVTKYECLRRVQKNIGPAGVVIAVIREDLITEDVLPNPLPVRQNSMRTTVPMYNTPPLTAFTSAVRCSPVAAVHGGLEAIRGGNGSTKSFTIF